VNIFDNIWAAIVGIPILILIVVCAVVMAIAAAVIYGSMWIFDKSTK
jgi:hypothetical protein